MKKYMKVMFGTTSHAGGFEYKINETNVAETWNPSADNPKDSGGFNFSTEDKIFRWLLRGDTLYDVEIPRDAEIIECGSLSTPHGVFRSNKIILSNPRKLDDSIVMQLYLKSDLPTNTYFQCLTFLSLRNYKEVCNKIIKDKVNKENIEQAINTFTTFFNLEEKDKNELYNTVLNSLLEIKREKRSMILE